MGSASRAFSSRCSWVIRPRSRSCWAPIDDSATTFGGWAWRSAAVSVCTSARGSAKSGLGAKLAGNMTNAPSTLPNAAASASVSDQSAMAISAPRAAQAAAFALSRTIARMRWPLSSRCLAVALPTWPVIPMMAYMRFFLWRSGKGWRRASVRATFAVEHGHLCGGVAIACRRTGRHGAFDRGEVVGGERYLQRAQRFVQAFARARPNQRHDVVAARQHPGDRQLRHAAAARVGELAQQVDQGQVALEVVALEARAVLAEVARVGAAVLRPVAADQAARQH